MNMIDSYKDFWSRAFDFKGVSSRSQYWWAFLCNFIIMFIIEICSNATSGSSESLNFFSILSIVLAIIMIIPNLSVTIRRIRDAGKNPWLYLLMLIPLIGAIIVFIFTLLPTKNNNIDYSNYNNNYPTKF